MINLKPKSNAKDGSEYPKFVNTFSQSRTDVAIYKLKYELRVKLLLLIKETQFFSFPPKTHQLVAMSLPTCNQKLKWYSMYLIFLHIMSKFHESMITFKGPTTSIIAFGGKMKQLFHYWQQ